MPGIPSMPNIPGGGSRAQRAAELKAELEAKAAATEQTAGAQFHQVQDGETLESIAGRYGQSSEAIWQHPLNKQLKNRLGTAEGLGRGDGIFIPGAEQEQEQSGGPVGQGDYIVKDGECISSIAKDKGHFWETIWNEPANSELKEARKDPNVLLADDRVTIPALRQKQEPGETEARHRFVRKGEPAKVRLRLLEGVGQIDPYDAEEEPAPDMPRGEIPYKVDLLGKIFEGTTDADGQLAFPIPGNARRGILTLNPGTEDEEVITLLLGRVAPITELSGVRDRLANLGFQCGGEGGEKITPGLKESLCAFQKLNGLGVTGEADQATREKLVEVHGS